MSTASILGIETSCDETAAAVVTEDLRVVSSVVESSIALHVRFGGVVPELAGRAQVDAIAPVLERALGDAGLDPHRPGVRAVAVTRGPGLVGSLLVGVSAAKALSLAWGVPLVGVNHLEGHLVASHLEHAGLQLPVVTLLVSGGHTMLVVERTPRAFELLGATIDDAVGEAYDKVARYLGLGYPGGPPLDAMASSGDPTAIRLPRPLRDVGLDVSLSGLKTAVVRAVDKAPGTPVADVAASFQAAVVDVLVAKCERAVEATGARTLALGGGVAANSQLRAAITELSAHLGIRCALPSLQYCTDNAAMIAAAGFHLLDRGLASPLSMSADPSLRLAAA
ncbi:MAG TPA: tRNA (adenosine(37)-N6)-threonylcarbamoyltransferase complex transferase subunit TsaD [Acidimicrobiales bacterium]|jgi:N6-L-threonylcarbamoyladenine synthase|nr:tRNA (adenosine(37)-N6)-threonylcarbamoyltransferase complex transferase subunit TsaD [Acidimicrobiales bacterium]